MEAIFNFRLLGGFGRTTNMKSKVQQNSPACLFHIVSNFPTLQYSFLKSHSSFFHFSKEQRHLIYNCKLATEAPAGLCTEGNNEAKLVTDWGGRTTKSGMGSVLTMFPTKQNSGWPRN